MRIAKEIIRMFRERLGEDEQLSGETLDYDIMIDDIAKEEIRSFFKGRTCGLGNVMVDNQYYVQ